MDEQWARVVGGWSSMFCVLKAHAYTGAVGVHAAEQAGGFGHRGDAFVENPPAVCVMVCVAVVIFLQGVPHRVNVTVDRIDDPFKGVCRDLVRSALPPGRCGSYMEVGSGVLNGMNDVKGRERPQTEDFPFLE